MVKALPKWRHSFATGTGSPTISSKAYAPMKEEDSTIAATPTAPSPSISSWALKPPRSAKPRVKVASKVSKPQPERTTQVTAAAVASRDDDDSTPNAAAYTKMESTSEDVITAIVGQTIQRDNDPLPKVSSSKKKKSKSKLKSTSKSILGGGEPHQPPSTVQIQGMSLLEKREDCMKQLQQANRIMYFHALQLIRKQKRWLEKAKTSPATSSANRNTIELRKQALLDLESNIEKAHVQDGTGVSPEKALFKATALLEDSMNCFLNLDKPDSVFHATQEAPEKERPPPPLRLPYLQLQDDATLQRLYSDGEDDDDDSCSNIYCDSTIRDGTVAAADMEKQHGRKQLAEYDDWMKSIEGQRLIVKAPSGDALESKEEEFSNEQLFAELDTWKKGMEKQQSRAFVPTMDEKVAVGNKKDDDSTTPDSEVDGSDHYFLQFDHWIPLNRPSMKGHPMTRSDHKEADQKEDVVVDVVQGEQQKSADFYISRIEI